MNDEELRVWATRHIDFGATVAVGILRLLDEKAAYEDQIQKAKASAVKETPPTEVLISERW